MKKGNNNVQTMQEATIVGELEISTLEINASLENW